MNSKYLLNIVWTLIIFTLACTPKDTIKSTPFRLSPRDVTREILTNKKGDIKVYELFNITDGRIAGDTSYHVNLHSECLSCEQSYAFDGKILLAGLFLIDHQSTSILPDEINIPSSIRPLPKYPVARGENDTVTALGNENIYFSDKGIICNDARACEIQIKTMTSQATLKPLPDPFIFRYDQNSDGDSEIFVCSTHNCCRHIALFKIIVTNQQVKH